jgi:hypothetical protein
MRTFAFALIAIAAPALARAAAPSQPAVWSAEAPKDAPTVLSFIDPGTGKMTLRLTCVRGSGQVVAEYALNGRKADHQEAGVWIDAAGVQAPWPGTVVFSSGGLSANLRGLTQADAATGASVATAEISTGAPVMGAFAKTGQISLTAQGETIAPPPAPGNALRKFLGPCR